MDQALREPTEKRDPLFWFSRFDPAEVRLVGDVVKTRGRMTFGEGDRPGTVRMTADYTFVYPLVKARPGADQVVRTIVRRTLAVDVLDPAEWQVTPGKLRLTEYLFEAADSSCSRTDGYLHPEFDEDVREVLPSGEAVDPYDRSRPQARVGEDEADCRPVARV
ncbi:hypothetical protein [Streptomyces sp. NBC_01216]|uniref:hypothetical protein n=1 Tax=unclassified Streptomyces TaxID=2593676 RepID=UPI002E14200C|nr:hypothetical protein OG393_12285 [Streptomyces sp. NBC_01216]